MKFPNPLIPGRLIKRYKRFLADIELSDGSVITAHCANPGSMMGLQPEGAPVWLSKSDNPKRKLAYSWELVEIDGTQICINTAHPNRVVEEAILNNKIAELQGYGNLRREVKYGQNSRIDILLEDDKKPDCYIEIKNVTLSRKAGVAEFPDSVTKRGTKHLLELADMVKAGHRAVMLYLIQRTDAQTFTLASDIDPAYADAFRQAQSLGVEAYAYNCTISPQEISLEDAVPIYT